MKNKWKYITMLLLSIMIFPFLTSAQNWKFIKEKHGVQLYSRHEAGKGLKYFKGVAEMPISAEKVFAMLENVHQTDWWTKDVTQLKVLHYEKDRLAQLYVVYRLPWPFKYRDLYVNITASINPITGERRLISVPFHGTSVENRDYVRIKDFREEYKIWPIDKNRSRLELEFYIDPGTGLPDWLVNMVLADSPIRIIKTIREYLYGT
jgi:hypothetical protein